MRLLAWAAVAASTSILCGGGCASGDDGSAGGAAGASGQSELLGAWFVADGFCGATPTKSNGLELRADGTFVAISAGSAGGVDQWKLDDGTYCHASTDWSGTYTWDGKVFAGSTSGAIAETFSGGFRATCAGGACTAQSTFASDAKLSFDDVMNSQGGLWCRKPARRSLGVCP